ncbi:hypothetical protein [uncultured Pontibacter sp.]|uniref:hypothetical protein n=1 Tax=uncultured Pontibacter sp. TaxID=453356 RepID=UPI002622C083|nr:hypothetical protein [uncultured Pontibacter sp.]
MKVLLIIIFSLTVSIQAFACECPELTLQELDKESYEWSEVVLTGTLTKAGKRYKVIVSEVLKGEVEGSILFGLTEGDEEIFVCTFFPHIEGEYLLYLKKTTIGKKTYYYSYACLGSRSLNMEDIPVALRTEESKEKLIKETKAWIAELRRKE